MEKNSNLILLGKRLRELRESKKFSQESFAFLIEMNRGYYGAIERGEVNVSFLNLLKISQGLKIPMQSIFEDHKMQFDEIGF